LDGLLENHHEDIPSQPDTQVSVGCPFEVVTRFMVMVGHIALRQMLFLDVAVFCELKRRNVLREERNECLNTKKQKKKKQHGSSRNSMSASETPRNKQELSDGDDEAGVVADDQEAEYIRNVCENEIVTGKGLLAVLSPLVVTICSNPNKYEDTKLQTAASLTMAKMMMVSSCFCEDHIQLLVTVLEKSTEPITRSNLIVALGDLSYRFPNIIVPWTSHIYGRLRDLSSEVRQVTLLVLTNLIMNDMVKVKGQISEMALCIVDTEQKIAEMASMFFTELSQKGNTLYNVMPDIISRLSTPDLNLDEEKFKTIMKFVMGLIQKDRQMESLVEKLCLRFRLSENERQWSDLAYCLSLLQYSERSLRRLSENLPCYADKLHSPKVYETFCSILASMSKTSKPELKAAVAELEAKINECNSKGAEDVLVSQKAAKASGRRRTAANTPAGNRNGCAARRQPSRSTVRHNRLRRRYSDSEDSDTSDRENFDEDDIFVRPRTTTRKVTGNNKIADDTESSDEDISASPDHKRQCSDREQRKISTTSTPQTRSTSRPKYSSQTRSARKPRTWNK
jgi:condensin complex subunit 1